MAKATGTTLSARTRRLSWPDDADVAVIAADASRMAVDVLIRPDASAFPHPGYVIGLSAEWIFGEPFDTRPIDFSPEGRVAARNQRCAGRCRRRQLRPRRHKRRSRVWVTQFLLARR
jgi:hypothetical protein